MMKARKCPCCGQRLKARSTLSPVELKAIRGALGVRSGQKRPMARSAFAELLGVSTRTLYNYEHSLTPIPVAVAQEARRLRNGT